jgi:hypothetical protein
VTSCGVTLSVRISYWLHLELPCPALPAFGTLRFPMQGTCRRSYHRSLRYAPAREVKAMDWNELDRTVPWIVPVPSGALHTRSLVIYEAKTSLVRVALPGRHHADTYMPGGDFVVQVDSAGGTTLSGASWEGRQFSHVDLFEDFERKAEFDAAYMQSRFAPALVQVVAEGEDPVRIAQQLDNSALPGLEVVTSLVASQCLALAEHRRYRRYEPRGGRCLPARFALGIIFRTWRASSAAGVQRKGAQGLQRLRREAGRDEPSFEAVLGRGLRSSACEVR